MRFDEAIAAQGDNLRHSRPAVQEALDGADLSSWRQDGLLFTGMGASSFATEVVVPGLLAAGLGARAAVADDVPPLVAAGLVSSLVAVSQEGTSTETLEACEAARGLPILAVTNDSASPVAGHAGVVVPLALLGDSSVYTLGYTATLQALGLLAEALEGHGADPRWDALPDEVERVLAEAATVVSAAVDELGVPRAVDFVGSGPQSAAANEGTLLVREASRLPSSYHRVRQYLHGMMEALEAGILVIILGDNREVRLAHDVAATGAGVLLLTSEDVAPAGGLHVVRLPALPAAQRAVLDILPGQLLAAELAGRQGITVGGFRYHQADTKSEADAGAGSDGGARPEPGPRSEG